MGSTLHFSQLVEQAVLFPFLDLDRDSLSKRYVLVHLHIPKTAGVALVSHIRKHLTTHGINHNRLDSAIDEFASMQGDPPEFVTGHIRLEHYFRFKHRLAPKEAIILGVLRDPIDRLISHYNYCSSPHHPWALQFVEQHLSFAAYVRSDRWHNNMARTLFGDEVRSLEDVERALMQRSYALCSMQRVAEVVAQVLDLDRGNRGRLMARKNVLETCYQKVRRADIDAQTMNLVRERNALDFALYDAVLKAEAMRCRHFRNAFSLMPPFVSALRSIVQVFRPRLRNAALGAD